MKRLDPSRTLFLEKDVAELNQSLRPIFDEIQDGKCDRLKKTQLSLVTRYRDMESYFRSFVERSGYQIDSKVDAGDRPREARLPEDRGERDELYRSLVALPDVELRERRDEPRRGQEAARPPLRAAVASKRPSRRPKRSTRAFLDSFASSLDPHSNYLSADDLEDFQIGMGLSLEGIGARALLARRLRRGRGGDRRRRGRAPAGDQAQGQDHRRRAGRQRARST